MEKSPLSASFVSAVDDQNSEVLIDDLTEAIDEFYTRYLCDPHERKETLRRMLSQGLPRPGQEETTAASLPATRADHANFNVELIALETQLEQAQQSIGALEESLEAKTRELESVAAENSDWRERFSALQRQHEDDLAAIQLWKARAQEALAAQAEFEKGRASAATPGDGANGSIPQSDFAAQAERWARAYAGKPGANMTLAQLGEVLERTASTLEILLQGTLKLMQGRLNFRDSSVDHHDPVKPAHALLHRARSVDDLKTFVFSASLAEPELSERLQALKREFVLLCFHQLALINGYRAGVNEGSHKLLEELEPEALQRQASRKGVRLGAWQLPNALVQVFAPGQFFSFFRGRYAALQQEDRSFFEKIFYPGFLRGYEACMASTRNMAKTTLNFTKANGAAKTPREKVGIKF